MKMLAMAALGGALLLTVRAEAGPWTTTGPTGGLVGALAIDPTNPAVVYAGTSSGGFFKSIDGGTTWTSISTGISAMSAKVITGIAIDPVTPTNVYGSWQSGVPGGIFRSTNGGASWTSVDVVGFEDVAIDPFNPTVLYAISPLYKSSNSGTSWTELLNGLFLSIETDPVTPGTVYAGATGTVFKSTDSGTVWTPYSSGLGSDTVDALAIDPNSPNVLYAGMDGTGLYKSVDGGETWSWLGLLAGLNVNHIDAIAFDPSDSDTVYAAGFQNLGPVGIFKTTDEGVTWTFTQLDAFPRHLEVNPVAPTTVIAGTGDGIWRSTDAGANWSEENAGFTNTVVSSLAKALSQAGTVYGSGNSRLYRTTDTAASWDDLAPIGDGFPVLSVAADPTDPDVAYAGTTLSGVHKTVNGGTSWSSTDTGPFPPVLVATMAIDPVTPTNVYAAGFGAVFKSTTGGGNWTLEDDGIFPLVLSLAIDPSAPGTLYAGTEAGMGPFAGVYKTTDAADNWAPVNTGLSGPAEASVTAVAIDPLVPTTVYIGVEETGVFKTVDGGANWIPASAGIADLDITSIAVDPVVPDIVYAGTLSGGVFTSTNGGSSWIATNDGLYNLSVRALVAEPNILYAGTGGNGTFTMDTSIPPPQTVLGKSLVVRDPDPADPSKRKLIVVAVETASPDTIDVSTLVANGATFSVTADGANPTNQTFSMPGPWTASGTSGAKYTDSAGVNGPIKVASLKKSGSGVLKLKVKALGNLGPGPQPHILVVPPNPGTGAQTVFAVNGGGSYCVAFGDAAGGVITNKAAKTFKVAKPTAEACTP